MSNKVQVIIGSGCVVERHGDWGYMLIGDDMRMNGLDSPARISNDADASKLIAEILKQFPNAYREALWPNE